MENSKNINANNLERSLSTQLPVIQLYTTFYHKFYILEWLLKKTLVKIVKKTLGESWFQKQIKNSKRLNLINEELIIIRIRLKSQLPISEDVLFNDANLGFWVEFFNKDVYKELKGCPIKIFTELPKQLKRKDIYKMLFEIKELRNDIYHHKNIFINNESKKEKLKYLQEIDTNLNLLIKALDPSVTSLLQQTNFKFI